MTFEDVPNPDDPTQVGVRLVGNIDRADDTETLAKYPATPSMLFATTMMRLFHAGVVDRMIGFVCRDIMSQAGVSLEEQERIRKIVDAQLGVTDGGG